MILQDSNILDDGEDVLESVSLAESTRRIENNKVKRGYNALDDDGMEIDEPDQGFVIGEKGRVERRAEISEALKGESLEGRREGIVDYMDKEEVVFKKKKVCRLCFSNYC
jgi:hypothetical protein